MQTIGIIGAMVEEIELLKSKIQNISEEKIRNFSFFIWNIGNKKIILTQSWIAKVNATIATTLLIERFEPDFIINTWTAWAIDSNLKIWDVVIAEKIFHHDADVTKFGYELWQIPKMPKFFESDKSLLEIAKNSLSNENFKTHFGIIASWDQFIATENQKNFLKNFENLQAVEMESAAIAQTATIMEIPFIIVRSISDNADGSAGISFEEFLEIASQNSATIVEKILENL